ncbi:MAG: VWA domain-containing protein [Bacteroidia bacterium]|nr:VWA domain-containing protein [Bacteroidia bacterium]
MKNFKKAVLIIFLFAFANNIAAQPGFEKTATNFGTDANGKTTRILFIFDCSFSMYGIWSNNETRMEIAKRILSSFMDSLKPVPNLEIAFRCYGHQTSYMQHDCKDTKLEVPFGKPSENAELIKSKIKALKPTGTTPIAYTLEQCAPDFTECTNCKNVIILITDGIEECDGDPCAISIALQKKKVFLRPFIIGISDIGKFISAFSCMGKFYNVDNPVNFNGVLKKIMTEAMTQTTVQVNLNDIEKKPTETDVDMTFYEQSTGKIIYNMIHTINERGNPDTIIINPDLTYKILVHTIPPIEKQNLVIKKGIHNTIPIDAPQGFLTLKVEGSYNDKPVQAIVRKAGEMKTLNLQEFEKTEKYLVGKYDLEVLTLPRTKIANVEIKQSSTQTIKIPGSGLVDMQRPALGSGSIYLEEGGKITWIFNLRDDILNEVFFLQPGNYRIEFRRKDQKDSEKSIEKKFSVKSGSNQTIKIQ